MTDLPCGCRTGVPGYDDRLCAYHQGYAEGSAEVARLKLLVRGACEACWTISWEPVKESDHDGIGDGHGGWMRCSYCWHLDQWQKREQDAADALAVESVFPTGRASRD